MKWAHSTILSMTKHTFIQVFFLLLACQNYLQSQTFLTASLNSPGNSGVLSENCVGPYELILRRGPDNDSLTEIFISGTGTATIGVDYSFGALFPVIMAIEDSVAIIPIDVVNDGNTEGLETIQLEIAFLAGEDSDFITFETAIVDGYSVEIQTSDDTIVWCRDVPYVLLATSDAEENLNKSVFSH